MLNWAIRYSAVLDLLTPLRPGTVLDVGSGAHGLARYWPGAVVQTDLDFGAASPGGDRGRAQLVCASADRLPFADASFDVVVSLDLMEHLPGQLRGVVLAEMLRTCRQAVIVGFPCGAGARRTDQRLARWLRRLGRPNPVWLDEHLALEHPTSEEFEAAVPPDCWTQTVTGNGNRSVHNLVLLAEETVGLRMLTKGVERLPLLPRPRALRRSRWPYRRVWLLRPADPAAR